MKPTGTAIRRQSNGIVGIKVHSEFHYHINLGRIWIEDHMLSDQIKINMRVIRGGFLLLSPVLHS